MDALEMIFKRRSIRDFLDKEVEEDNILTLLKAATAAPSAANCQPWEFIVISDKETLNMLKTRMVFAKYNAPLAIVVCGNMKLAFKGPTQAMWVQDCSAATQNILLAATAVGLGSVWIGVHPLESNISAVKDILNIPDYVVPLNIVYLGYPKKEKEPRTRFNDKRVYYQSYDAKRKHRANDKPVVGHY